MVIVEPGPDFLSGGSLPRTTGAHKTGPSAKVPTSVVKTGDFRGI
jgi:hypothetical protein